MKALVSRMVDTYEFLTQTDHEAKTVEECRLPIQLQHLTELKSAIHRTKLEIEDVDNIKKKQEWLLEGSCGLKAEAKVLSRDQRYSSNAARDLAQNFTRSLAPTDYFDRIYASLCVQMTDLQNRIYEVESVVNPAAYRAAVARDRNQQLRRNQWARRNAAGGGHSRHGGGYDGYDGDDGGGGEFSKFLILDDIIIIVSTTLTIDFYICYFWLF
jgi:hypothetical protein